MQIDGFFIVIAREALKFLIELIIRFGGLNEAVMLKQSQDMHAIRSICIQ